MRILILTHQRSGGFSLLSWISSEFVYKQFHEPFLNPEDDPSLTLALTLTSVTVKENISHLLQRGIDPAAFIATFDRVIFHCREDLHACAISRARQTESGESHLAYPMHEDWILAHSLIISRYEQEIAADQQEILACLASTQKPWLRTSYEGIYHSQEDVPRVIEFLGIYDPQWLDAINPQRRLQNGPPVRETRKKPKLI